MDGFDVRHRRGRRSFVYALVVEWPPDWRKKLPVSAPNGEQKLDQSSAGSLAERQRWWKFYANGICQIPNDANQAGNDADSSEHQEALWLLIATGQSLWR